MLNPPPPPPGLLEQGGRFWAKVVAEFELDERDFPVLLETCRCLDEIDGLAAAVARDGVLSTGARGQPKEHPALGGLRAHRMSLERLMVRLALPGAEGDLPLSVTSLRAKRAADARWSRRDRDVS